MMWGLDVSRWQGHVEWPAVAGAGAGFAVCKVTQGTRRVDPRWVENRDGARAAGVPVGGYHFAHPELDARAQLDHFLRHAQLTAGDLVPVLDLENAGGRSPREVTRFALAWLEGAHAAVGAVPVIYTGPGWASTNLHPDPALARFPLWVAHYTSAPAPRLPKPWPSWLWWQHTQTGRCAGVVGDVDLNRASSDQLPTIGGRPAAPTEEDPLARLTDDEVRKLATDAMTAAVTAIAVHRLLLDALPELIGPTGDDGSTRPDRVAALVTEHRAQLDELAAQLAERG